MASKKKRPPEAAKPSTRAGTVALVGRPNVGKSTLLNALLGERIAITSPHPQTTRDRIAGIVTRGDLQYVFLDTPGLHKARHKLGERMNEVARSTAADADVAIFVTEPELRPAPPPSAAAEGGEAAGERAPRTMIVAPTLREEDRAILAAIPEKAAVIVVINKVDKIKPKSLLFPLLEGILKERDVAAIIPVSALKGDGLERVLEEAGKHLPESEHLYEEDELSDKPLRFFVGEFVREQILKRTRQEVPHGVAVTVESFEEGDTLVRISVTVHVAKDSHKGIIIGDGGAMLKSVGMAARRRAEELLQRKVHLETFVRATPGWFDDAARLADMGYAGGEGDRAKRRRGGRPRTKTKGGKRGQGARGTA